MRHVLRGLGGAHRELLVRRQAHAVQAPQVQRPFEFQRQHAAMARLQPDLQLREQALGGPHQLGRGGGQRGEFDVQVELLGQREPGDSARAARP